MNDPGIFEGLGMFVVLLALGVPLLLATRRHRSDMIPQIRLFVAAFTIRFAFSLLIYCGGLINILKDEDGSGWGFGVTYMERWVSSGLGVFDIPGVCMATFTQHNKGYGYMLGAVFFYTGMPYRLVAAALNCFFGALTAVFA